MDRNPQRDELLRALAYDYWYGSPQTNARSNAMPQPQQVPLNIYETAEDVLILAPMPGVEAGNIDVQIQGQTVTLRASMRGPHQQDRRYLLREWTYGPYERTVTLPIEIDGSRANASHSNGILALSIPKGAGARSVRVPLRQRASSESVHEGHSGHHTTREGLPD